ncbi:hypothetical protein TNIN_383441 [Trichonephila inaurata madagascariensis]|uniref:Reverse transcriptase domain-containing protein n=1 Tax=Trichonephila inaurata madagascariensis TaxID=2747483 RepID=A0A8X7C742_9ARAC|nr:hypothetical protein TNIN_383441 [Trichonephila inaurata madagascariensis]
MRLHSCAVYLACERWSDSIFVTPVPNWLAWDFLESFALGIITSDGPTNIALFADDLAVWCCASKEQSELNSVQNKSLGETRGLMFGE